MLFIRDMQSRSATRPEPAAAAGWVLRRQWPKDGQAVAHFGLIEMTQNWKHTRDLSSENGSVVVEFCLILPVLVLLFVGVIDLGLGVQQAMVVSEAAHAGTAYSCLPGKASDLQGMQNAAVAAAGTVSPFSVTAANWCSCTANGSQVLCSSTCGGASPIEYAQVKTSATLPVLLGYPGLPASFSLNGFSAVRVH